MKKLKKLRGGMMEFNHQSSGEILRERQRGKREGGIIISSERERPHARTRKKKREEKRGWGVKEASHKERETVY